MLNETNYTESETGAAMCGTCDKWIDGIGSNACVCCTTCEGTGGYMFDGSPATAPLECEQCNGTGRAKAVA